MIITKDNTLSEVVSDDFRTAAVFSRYGLDFCCNGKVTISEACDKKSLDSDAVISELENTVISRDGSIHFKYWNPDFLTEYITNNHHAYVREMIPVIQKHAEKVAKAHGDEHTELKEILKIFTCMSEELITHMDKEEKMLFPYIKKLCSPFDIIRVPPFGSVKNPISVMESEHESAGSAMAKIRELTNDFNPPAKACNTYKILFKELNEFEQDLHVHVHLENNILFPKARKLEEKFSYSASCSL